MNPCHVLTLELSEKVFADLESQAAIAGVSPAQLAVAALESRYGQSQRPTPEELQATRTRFERYLGAVDLGQPVGVDNEGIDAYLTRVYGETG